MARRRLEFLPSFFAVLFLVFAVAVFLRIRSYRGGQRVAPARAAVSAPAADERRGERPDQGVILELPAPTTRSTSNLVASPTATSPAELRTPPPRPRSAASSKPSLLDRVLVPVVSAFGGGPPPVQSAAAARPPRRPSADVNPRGIERTSASSAASSSGQPPAEGANRTRESDRTSDSTAPQLAGIEFVPAEVQDGQETVLIVTATDDLSGVQSISGTIVAPSGAVQGFACQREGDTNRYQSRITVPREAAEGMWRVNYISLVDRASNSATLTAATGGVPPGAAFKVVSSRPDSEGPTLRAIWVDRRAMRGGEKNTIFIDAVDERSGVNLITGVLQSPSKFARVGFICKSGTAWTCELAAPACADCGDWMIEQIQLQDKANNMTTVRADNALVGAIRIDISSDSCDATPPALESMTLSTSVVTNTTDSNITVTATLSDDACGVLSVSGQAAGPGVSGPPPRRYFSLAASSDARTWTGTLTIPRLAAKGLWRVSFVQVLDRAHNLKTYGQSDPVLAPVTFTVQ